MRLTTRRPPSPSALCLRWLAVMAIPALALAFALARPPRAAARKPAPPAPPAAAPAAALQSECNGGRGGTVFATGKEVIVEILPGNPSASFTSDLFLSVDGRRPMNFGTSRDSGRITRIGRVPAGTELAFFIIVRQTGHTFFIGPGSRNPDGIPHADVQCFGGGGGVANVSFEDLINGGDNSFNDLRFQVRTSPPCNANARRRARTESITSFPPCGGSSTGTLSPVWGSFGARQTLESDAGERLQLRCDPGGIPSYHLYFARPDEGFHVVGTCPFIGGCNNATFKHSGDEDGNGKPDCFVQTYWRSKDYHLNDNPNPWTGQSEATPVLDHAVSSYDVINNNLTKENLKYRYRLAPPVTCGTNAEGAFLGTIRIDPPLGPLTDAFFAEADQRLQLLGPTDVPMTEDPSSLADLNGDGQLNELDRTVFDAAFGSCEGAANYNPAAEFNSDGCITIDDEEAFLDLLGVGDGENTAPVASCATVTLAAASGSCSVTVTPEDVNGGSSDPDGDAITLSLGSPATLGVGTHQVTLVVTDSRGASSSCVASVTVVDGTPPAISVPTLSHTSLWPPDHRMVDVTVDYTAVDNCGPATASLSVTSNEPVDAEGDGHTSPDWEVVDAHHVRLRAERAGGGTGRVYTITITAVDASGHTSHRAVTVSVPHD